MGVLSHFLEEKNFSKTDSELFQNVLFGSSLFGAGTRAAIRMRCDPLYIISANIIDQPLPSPPGGIRRSLPFMGVDDSVFLRLFPISSAPLHYSVCVNCAI